MGDDESLVLAMPRRELFRISGFCRAMDFAVLDSLSEESWFAAPPSLRDNFDAKEVRLGLVSVRREGEGDQVLVSEAGVVLHATPIPPEVGVLGQGLRALRNLALAAGTQLLGRPGGQVELIGYCNEEALPECRWFFIMVYRLRVPPGSPAPAGMSWIALDHLHGVPLDPVSALVAAHLSG
jgi:hypothetical protein